MWIFIDSDVKTKDHRSIAPSDWLRFPRTNVILTKRKTEIERGKIDENKKQLTTKWEMFIVYCLNVFLSQMVLMMIFV